MDARLIEEKDVGEVRKGIRLRSVSLLIRDVREIRLEIKGVKKTGILNWLGLKIYYVLLFHFYNKTGRVPANTFSDFCILAPPTSVF